VFLADVDQLRLADWKSLRPATAHLEAHLLGSGQVFVAYCTDPVLQQNRVLEGKFAGGVEVFAATLVQGSADAEKGEVHVGASDYICAQEIWFVDAVEEAVGGEARGI
jgi:hypothetical protein